MLDSATSRVESNAGLIRVGGLAVVVGLFVHIYVNGFLKQFPPLDLPPAELRAYLSEEASTWAIVHGLKYLALAGLVLFAAAAYARTRGKNGVSNGWGIIGVIGTSIHVTNAMIANGIEVLAFYDFTKLSGEADLFWLLFYIVRTLFTAEILAWGLVILGFSLAGFQSGTIPRWMAMLGFLSSAACVASGAFVVSILNQGWATGLMDAAGLTGMIWFGSMGIFMLFRGDS